MTDAPGAKITVTYEEAGDYEVYAAELKDRQVLERAAALITESYVLPGPVSFVATLCGEANAYYSPSESTVTYCYELADSMFTLYVEDILPLSEEPEQVAEPAERAASPGPKQDLVGRWSAGEPAPN